MSELFTPYRIGPLEIRNRTIRSAAFEGMCENNSPSKSLFDYHTAVARGGIGMTTVAYAAVCRSGLSFERQLWMREEIVPELKKLTDAIHAEGAKASIQLGHCGNMSHKRICGCLPYGASSGFNLYSPTFVHGMNKSYHSSFLHIRTTGRTNTAVPLTTGCVSCANAWRRSRRPEKTRSPFSSR